MPKSKKKTPPAGRRSAPGSAAMEIFLGGCAAELYLLAVLRYCVNNGIMRQMLAWDTWLWYSGWIGVGLLGAGLALYLPGRAAQRRRSAGLPREMRKSAAVRPGEAVRMRAAVWLLCAGLFLVVSGFGGHFFKSSIRVWSVVVPAAMLLYLFWALYERECALSLTLLGVSLVAAWLCRRTGYQYSPYNMPVKLGVMVYLVVIAVTAYSLWKRRPWALLPRNADTAPVYLACLVSAAAMLASFLGSQPAYYAMWTLALAAFGVIVYYTVKQL